MNKFSKAIVMAVTGFVAWGSLRSAPAPVPKDPLVLSLELDRSSYLQQEPIFLDLRLTNASEERLHLPALAIYMNLRFEVQPEKGKAVELRGMGHAPDVTKLLFVWLESRRTQRASLVLQHYGRPDDFTTGSFTVRAVCDIAYAKSGKKSDAVPLRLTSDLVKFSVQPPSAAEKETVAYLRGLPGERGWSTWYYLSESLEHVEKTTRSPRFRALSRCFLGRLEFGVTRNGAIYADGDRAAARKRIREVMASPYASGHLKRMAASQLPATFYEEKQPGSAYRTAEALRSFIAEYPETVLADGARKAFDALMRARGRKPADDWMP